tara:strand:- start:556 stop:1272 length:717 start_codon:yes stop_codon:yes gene_type:complete
MFDECKIKFYAEEEYIKNSPNLLPVPTKLNIPSWFKKLDHKIDQKTIKGCMPFLDAITSGYILKVPTDMELAVKHEDDKIHLNLNIASKDHITNSPQKLDSTFHNKNQLEGSPMIEKNNGMPFLKIMNPWTIRTPKGYSCLFLNVLNNNQNNFEIISGIVDTDIYRNKINFPIVFKKHTKENSYSIKAGTPYVQVIPFKRDHWKMEVKKDSKPDIAIGFWSSFLHSYKTKVWKKKKWT